jgi:pimeloyl-ACP methyl ester carboxylesterase
LVIYLHGFASSPQSAKAAYLGERLRDRGVEFHAPDLNLPSFSTLTVTRMLEQTRALIDRSTTAVTLIGSSLGGYVAVNAAATWPDRVARLVLLAPALDFHTSNLPEPSGPLGADIGEWKRAGRLDVFHFGYGRTMPIDYALYEDAHRYNAMDAVVPMPTLVFQGRRDATVDPAVVEAWARRRPNVELHLLDDDHQLAASLGIIWESVAGFLKLRVS